MSETQLVSGILRALITRDGIFWRTNSGVLVLGAGAQRRVMRGNPAGSPDILGVVGKRGRLVGLEVKTADGKLRPSQAAWHAKMRTRGVSVEVVRSIREALAWVDEWIDQEIERA